MNSFFRPEVLIFMIPIVAILSGTFLAMVRIMRGEGRGRGESSEEDARVIQDIYSGLLKMEKRVEALETIVLERERSRKSEE